MFGVVLICLFLVNNVFLFVYCRVAERMDKKIAQNTAKHEKDLVRTKRNIETPNDRTVVKEKNGFKQKLIKIYFELNHYLYGWMRYCILCTGKIPSNRIRKFFYRVVFGMKISRKTTISGGCEFRSPWNIVLGNCVIQSNCIFDGRSSIVVKDNVVFGTGVHIWTQEHDVQDSYFAVNDSHKGAVIIDEHAWICSDTTILPGLHIKEGAVLASRAVATKDCEAFGIYGGIPAKKIGERTRNLRYELSGKPHWHFY